MFQTGFRKLLCINRYGQNFFTEKIMTLGTTKLCFLTVFFSSIFCTLLKNYPPKTEIWCPIKRKVFQIFRAFKFSVFCLIFFCLKTTLPNFLFWVPWRERAVRSFERLHPIENSLRKNHLYTFSPFLKLFDSQKLLSQIWDFEFNRKNRLFEASCKFGHAQNYFTQKNGNWKKNIFWSFNRLLTLFLLEKQLRFWMKPISRVFEIAYFIPHQKTKVKKDQTGTPQL